MGTDLERANSRPSLLAKFGERYSLEPQKLYETLCKTVFAEAQNQEQVIALLVVADQYGLSPLAKEIFAFPDKRGGVVPVVGIDGWNRIAQQHPQFDGVELRYSETIITPQGGKPCPEWVEAVVYRKDRQHPVVVREYLDECYRNTGPWQSHTKRMLRHKALIQGYRTAFGFHGIYDQDEAESIADHNTVEPLRGVAAERVAQRLGIPKDEEAVEVTTEVDWQAIAVDAEDNVTALAEGDYEPEPELAEEPLPEPVEYEPEPLIAEDEDEPPGVARIHPERLSPAQKTKILGYVPTTIYEAELSAILAGYGADDVDDLSKEDATKLLGLLKRKAAR